MLAPKIRSGSSTSIGSAATSSSLSSLSSLSTSASSFSSARAEDMINRLLAHTSGTDVHVWSTGNVRINTRDRMLAGEDAVEVLSAMRDDKRFQFVDFIYLGDGEEWKASYRLLQL